MSSKFANCPEAPPIAVFALTAACKSDDHPQKVDLGVGAYRTDEGKPWVLPVVRNVETEIASDPTINHEYIPVTGRTEYTEACCKLALGDDSAAITENRALGIRSVGGTGAIRLGAEFLRRFCDAKIVYVSNPTWGNHKTIFKYAHFEEIKEYRYWNDEKRCLDYEGMLADLRAAPEGAVVILHAVAHNPTGIDPTQEQWLGIFDVIQERRLFAFFDFAYQGFASGDLDRDGWAVRTYVNKGFECFIAQSFSKNFGLYNERVGNLAAVVNDSKVVPAMKSQLAMIVRTMYSNPTSHGSQIVSRALTNPTHLAEWKANIVEMSSRIAHMRQLLYQKLKALGTPGTWNHIIEQIGMFSFTGLNPKQVQLLVGKYHIYLMKSGRISMAGVTTKNVDYIAQAIHEAVTTIPDDPKM